MFLVPPYSDGVGDAKSKHAPPIEQAVTIKEGDYDVCSRHSFGFDMKTDLF